MGSLILCIAIIFGISISALNFYLCWLYPFFEKNRESFVSGIPLIGSLSLFMALFNIDSNWLFYIVVFFILIDTNGIHWIIVYLIYDKFKYRNYTYDTEKRVWIAKDKNN